MRLPVFIEAGDNRGRDLRLIQQESWFSSTVSPKLEDGAMWPYDYDVNQTYSIITITKKPEESLD